MKFEIVCCKYEEGLDVSLCFTVMMKVMLKSKDRALQEKGGEVVLNGGAAARLNEIINQLPSASSGQCAAQLTDLENSFF